FERPEIRSRCQELLSMSDLVYARDPESMRQVLSIGADPVRVRLAPDFTGLVPAAWSGASPGTVAIIPNSNMVARGDDPESYYAYLTAIVRAARAHGERPYLLVHAQDGDYEIARRVSASAN